MDDYQDAFYREFISHFTAPRTIEQQEVRAAAKQIAFSKLYGGEPVKWATSPTGRMRISPPPLTQSVRMEKELEIDRLLYDIPIPPGDYNVTAIQDELIITPRTDGPTMNRKTIENELAAMTARVAELQLESQKFAAFPEDDTYADGTVILFTLAYKKRVPSENSTPRTAYMDEYIPAPGNRQRMKTVKFTYEYVAFRTGDSWYVTGENAPSNIDWDGLVNFIACQDIVRFGVVKDLTANWLVGEAPVAPSAPTE